MYADGAETEVDCNRCVCACGNWVCTAMTCDGELCLRQKKEQKGQSSFHEITMKEVRMGMMEKRTVVAGSKESGQQVTDSHLSYWSSQKAALRTEHLSQTQKI